jgi:EAL domain-containing protein (putative c-di-GMP-specific phosphodiesterase class I)/GGDEF domain-containing protein
VAKLDIVGFGDITNGFGHDAGDALLVHVAERLAGQGADLLARLHSDEFALAVVLDKIGEAERWLDQVTKAARGLKFADSAIDVRFAAGFSIGNSASSALGLVREAGTALHRARRMPLPSVQKFDCREQIAARERIRLTGDLQQALAKNELRFDYLPKFDLRSGALIGAEALLRWHHPVLGRLPPGRFVGLAEATGLIVDIGRWARMEVTRFAAEHNRGRTRPFRLAVNVSSSEFVGHDFSGSVEQALTSSGLDPACLVIEVTESIMVDATPELLAQFDRLRAMGMGLSVDDFGTGYSSLRYLDQFPFTEIKIDRSFVSRLPDRRTMQIVVKSIIELGRELGLDVVAEGIETEAERSLLQAMHCPYGQGFLLGRPLDRDSFRALARLG